MPPPAPHSSMDPIQKEELALQTELNQHISELAKQLAGSPQDGVEQYTTQLQALTLNDIDHLITFLNKHSGSDERTRKKILAIATENFYFNHFKPPPHPLRPEDSPQTILEKTHKNNEAFKKKVGEKRTELTPKQKKSTGKTSAPGWTQRADAAQNFLLMTSGEITTLAQTANHITERRIPAAQTAAKQQQTKMGLLAYTESVCQTPSDPFANKETHQHSRADRENRQAMHKHRTAVDQAEKKIIKEALKSLDQDQKDTAQLAAEWIWKREYLRRRSALAQQMPLTDNYKQTIKGVYDQHPEQVVVVSEKTDENGKVTTPAQVELPVPGEDEKHQIKKSVFDQIEKDIKTGIEKDEVNKSFNGLVTSELRQEGALQEGSWATYAAKETDHHKKQESAALLQKQIAGYFSPKREKEEEAEFDASNPQHQLAWLCLQEEGLKQAQELTPGSEALKKKSENIQTQLDDLLFKSAIAEHYETKQFDKKDPKQAATLAAATLAYVRSNLSPHDDSLRKKYLKLAEPIPEKDKKSLQRFGVELLEQMQRGDLKTSQTVEDYVSSVTESKEGHNTLHAWAACTARESARESAREQRPENDIKAIKQFEEQRAEIAKERTELEQEKKEIEQTTGQELEQLKLKQETLATEHSTLKESSNDLDKQAQQAKQDIQTAQSSMRLQDEALTTLQKEAAALEQQRDENNVSLLQCKQDKEEAKQELSQHHERGQKELASLRDTIIELSQRSETLEEESKRFLPNRERELLDIISNAQHQLDLCQDRLQIRPVHYIREQLETEQKEHTQNIQNAKAELTELTEDRAAITQKQIDTTVELQQAQTAFQTRQSELRTQEIQLTNQLSLLNRQETVKTDLKLSYYQKLSHCGKQQKDTQGEKGTLHESKQEASTKLDEIEEERKKISLRLEQLSTERGTLAAEIDKEETEQAAALAVIDKKLERNKARLTDAEKALSKQHLVVARADYEATCQHIHEQLAAEEQAPDAAKSSELKRQLKAAHDEYREAVQEHGKDHPEQQALLDTLHKPLDALRGLDKEGVDAQAQAARLPDLDLPRYGDRDELPQAVAECTKSSEAVNKLLERMEQIEYECEMHPELAKSYEQETHNLLKDLHDKLETLNSQIAFTTFFGLLRSEKGHPEWLGQYTDSVQRLSEACGAAPDKPAKEDSTLCEFGSGKDGEKVTTYTWEQDPITGKWEEKPATATLWVYDETQEKAIQRENCNLTCTADQLQEYLADFVKKQGVTDLSKIAKIANGISITNKLNPLKNRRLRIRWKDKGMREAWMRPHKECITQQSKIEAEKQQANVEHPEKTRAAAQKRELEEATQKKMAKLEEEETQQRAAVERKEGIDHPQSEEPYRDRIGVEEEAAREEIEKAAASLAAAAAAQREAKQEAERAAASMTGSPCSSTPSPGRRLGGNNRPSWTESEEAWQKWQSQHQQVKPIDTAQTPDSSKPSPTPGH